MNKIDFETDLKNEILRLFRRWNIKVNPNKRTNKILLDYLTIRTKLISQKIRKVRFSPLFEEQLPRHPKRKEIQNIIEVAKNGKDLNAFQSKRLLQTNFHDHLLNEWSIYHFHLSPKKDKDPLLFSYVDEEQIIFLGTDTHKVGIFADNKWIEILHDHFPEVIEEFQDTGIKNITPNYTPEKRQEQWNKGYTLIGTKIRDVVYNSPGAGRVTSGHGMKVAKTANLISVWLIQIEKQLRNSIDEVCEYLNTLKEDAVFKIRIGARTIELIEDSTNSILLEFPAVFIDKSEIKTLATTDVQRKAGVSNHSLKFATINEEHEVKEVGSSISPPFFAR